MESERHPQLVTGLRVCFAVWTTDLLFLKEDGLQIHTCKGQERTSALSLCLNCSCDTGPRVSLLCTPGLLKRPELTSVGSGDFFLKSVYV